MPTNKREQSKTTINDNNQQGDRQARTNSKRQQTKAHNEPTNKGQRTTNHIKRQATHQQTI